MLISLDRTYRGRTHKWWLQSAIILTLLVFLGLLTYYFVSLYAQFELLKTEHQRLERYILVDKQEGGSYRGAPILSRVNYTHEYLQYLNQFQEFEKKASLAKWMRVYRSKHALYRQKNDLELALTSDMVAPVMIGLGKELSSYSQKWERASVTEKNQMQLKFKQTILLYEMVAKRHGYKILSSDWMRKMVIQSWYEFMLNQAGERVQQSTHLPSYQELYPKLEGLVEFYFQLPNLENSWIKPDRALLEKTKNQLNLNQDADVYIS
jgi:hypothetical protein